MTKERPLLVSRRAALGATAATLIGASVLSAAPASAVKPGVVEWARIFNVKDFGALGDGVVDDTAKVAAAIAAATAAGGGVVFFPPGTYVRSSQWDVSSNVWVHGSGQGATTIRVKEASASVTVFGLGENVTNSRISDLSIDGNKGAQVESGFGIVGWHSSGNTVDRVTVANVNGIGIGLSGCWDWRLTECTVLGSGNYQPGIWSDIDTGADPFNRGGHRFEALVCRDNDLDGMICNSPNCTIVESEFVNNGLNVPASSGALGGGGLYNDRDTKGTTIANCRFGSNTEFGINMILSYSTVEGNISEDNALSGMHVRSGSNHVVFNSNICRNNGNASSTVTAYSNSGISFDSSSYLTITGNDCSDDRVTSTQEWGVHALDNTGITEHVLVVANTLSPNKLGSENLSSSSSHPNKVVLGNQ